MSLEILRGDRRHHARRVVLCRAARLLHDAPMHPGESPGKVCSCAVCGGPQRCFGLPTVQEVRAGFDAETRTT